MDSAVFQSLPYEVAHAIVRTLCLHTQIYHKAKEDYESLRDKDPNEKKTKTTKAREHYETMCSCERFAVMNRRTGFVATSEWLNKHITVSSNGKPELKKSDGKVKPWILTLKIRIDSHHDVQLQLRTQEGKPFRVVKCFDLRQGMETTNLSKLTVGYAHLFDKAKDTSFREGCTFTCCNISGV